MEISEQQNPYLNPVYITEKIECPHCQEKQDGITYNSKARPKIASDYKQYHRVCIRCREEFIYWVQDYVL